MGQPISPGKFRRLQKLSDGKGQFRMLAIDQRGSMIKALSRAADRDPDDITYQDTAQVKRLITQILSPLSTATLIDPQYGYPYSIDVMARDTALLLSREETGYEKAGPGNRERRTILTKDWNIEKAARAGADAIKLLIYYRADTSAETSRYQQQICQDVGEQCLRHDLLFLLELVTYPFEAASDSAQFAREKPGLVVEMTVEFSKPHYHVDILKLQFPAELKYADRFADGAFDNRKREAVYGIAEVEQFCREVHQAAAVPWVILSAGVDIQEFLENIRLACGAGASGFLCGRAIWSTAIDHFPDLTKVERSLADESARNFRVCNDAAGTSLPWYSHPRFGSRDEIVLAQQSESWYRDFSAS